MNLHWLLRMSQWTRNPPSAKKAKVVLTVIAVLLIIFGLESLGYWPDAMTANRVRY